MELYEIAETLQRKGIGSVSPNTLIRYFQIYEKYLFYRRFNKTKIAVEKTANFSFCSSELVWKIITFMKKII